MTTHQQKKLDVDALLAFRDRFALPLTDDDSRDAARSIKPADDSAEMRYLHERRAALGGYLPARRSDCAPVPVPPLDALRGVRAAGRRQGDVARRWRSCACSATC